ncbi:MAG: D-alanyl-D-alanine carboxypeptidase family protein [Acutalibacteraceae bacterium]|nr:M15 family metallopeptidase [Bacillota bacterium]
MVKGTGKYYSPVYKAKKYSCANKKSSGIKRIVCACIAVAFAASGIIAWQSVRADANTFATSASAQSYPTDVDSYPRIVNESKPVDKSYEPQNLVSLNTVPNGQSVYLRSDAAESFINMLDAMAKDGLAVLPVKGYTSYDAQQAALSESIDKFIAEGCSSDEATQKTSLLLSTPGTDESQLGTSIDVSTDVNSVEKFSATEQYKWICNNAYKFGFIIRYTADKQEITGVEARPWHLRFVGESAAEYMKENGMCLEEYVKCVMKYCPGATQEY